jgi:hypothetical protein
MVKRIVTADEFDIHEPFRQYVFTFLLFDCHRCKKTFSGEPPYSAAADCQWFEDTAEEARKAGWCVSAQQRCLCPDCAATSR